MSQLAAKPEAPPSAAPNSLEEPHLEKINVMNGNIKVKGSVIFLLKRGGWGILNRDTDIRCFGSFLWGVGWLGYVLLLDGVAFCLDGFGVFGVGRCGMGGLGGWHVWR